MSGTSEALSQFPTLSGLKLLNRGKVRDVYEVDEAHLLFVATDRISAYDVIMKNVRDHPIAPSTHSVSGVMMTSSVGLPPPPSIFFWILGSGGKGKDSDGAEPVLV